VFEKEVRREKGERKSEPKRNLGKFIDKIGEEEKLKLKLFIRVRQYE
jgi:hypothetical protein